MSENSSDSESSCGWTILNHEGSDIETLHCEVEPCPDFDLEHSTAFVENVQPDSADDLSGVCSNEVPISNVESLQYTVEDQQEATELLSSYHSSTKPESPSILAEHHDEGGAGGEDSHCEAVSDDSDIVTLEPPKVDEVGPLEEEIPEDLLENKDLNMSFSSSSQYTFSQPETVFPSQPSEEESSNDEASDYCGPILRRRRSRKSTTSGSESENRTSTEQPPAPAPRTLGWMGSGLNKCIILALVIAISMGFGHFYGTIQILERQRNVEKIRESELNEMKDDLYQCQREQEVTIEHKLPLQDVVEQLTEDLEEKHDLVLSLEDLMDQITKENHMLKQKQNDLKLEADDLTVSLKTTEVQNKNLALENQHLRESLEKEEQALSSLKEELRKLREQIRNLDEKGRHEIMLLENQKLKEHLKEERHKVRTFRTQKESLLNEAQLLRKELDNERKITDTLRVELEEISKRRSSADSFESDQEIEHLKDRLSELEKKLNFEQQRSDLWERLYIETKEQNEKLEDENSHQETDHSKGGPSKGKTKKGKDTFFNSVKDTFDAMKNSTKEFVRHHKEKIKQAKEAVKENLKKFSDSVKNTFRHFKDTTRNMFNKNRNRKYGERRREETKGARSVRREHGPNAEKMYPNKATAGGHEYEEPQNDQRSDQYEDGAAWKSPCEEKASHYPNKKGCSGVYDCAHQESISLFNKVLDPVRVEEFNDLMQVYLQEQVDNFQHWEELEQFINRFFPDGIFIHDQMLFTDFVKNVEDYLEDMKEYQTSTGGVFEDLDEFVYRHYFGNAYSTAYGPRKPERVTPYKNSENKNQRKEEEKHQARYKREGKWNKHGRANGRQMANVEIELGQLPFDPKY
ncbi:cell cycle progression protein 1 isoform X2 [Dendropsophus ebraccatus]|uniref:cell cycle progression protein 1 isoform X2 n=1 Tax=Dendropsophus ebraccatus TaxID=150705 RepID=UPI0038314FD6